VNRRVFRLSDGRLATVQRTNKGMIVRTSDGEVITTSATL
jgi:hypothetical protein